VGKKRDGMMLIGSIHDHSRRKPTGRYLDLKKMVLREHVNAFSFNYLR
jgi:hypothetical protein